MEPKYKVTYFKYLLRFKQPVKTSRDTLDSKNTWFLKITDTINELTGIGECSTIPGLSIDDEKEFENILKTIKDEIEKYNRLDISTDLTRFPSLQFGLETAVKDLANGGKRLLFDTEFTRGDKNILINGLIWMADLEKMKMEVRKKIEEGYSCIKLKIGGLNFSDELALIRFIRDEYPAGIELRLDANGAFTFEQATGILNRLEDYNIHSIEQPIPAGQWDNMAKLCRKSLIPIALDEELIGISHSTEKVMLIEKIKPHYLILKPSLIGGFVSAEEWIHLACSCGTGWWATSALESNIGLNAIAQWVSQFNTSLAQGLGTGTLYDNNFQSPLVTEKGYLRYNGNSGWKLESIC